MSRLSDLLLKNKTLHISLSWMLAALLLAYVAVRASLLSFTYDEVISFENMKTFSLAHIGDSANNHLLNLLLMSWSYRLFGNFEWALRLPNVLAFVIYLVAAMSINNLLRLPYRISAIVLLCSMPFLLDFFSLARGYGLGLGLMLGSLYFLASFLKNKKFYASLISIALAWLALLANFTLMNYFIPLGCVLLIAVFFGPSKLMWKFIFFAMILVLIAASIYSVLPLLQQLKGGNQLYFGGRNGFFSDTIGSLGRCYAYMQPYGRLAKWAFMLMFTSSILISVINLVSSVVKRKTDIAFGFSLIFLLSLASTIAQHVLFKNNYLVERTAIFYVPLMMLNLIIWGDLYRKKFARYAHLALLFLCSLHLALCLNFSHTYSWKYDCDSKDAISYLKYISTTNHVIGVDYIHTPSAIYYQQKMNAQSLQLRQVCKDWRYPMPKEELQAYYYGVDQYCNDAMKYDIKAILSDDVEYYYLDRYFADELQKSGVQVRILKSFPVSQAIVIQITAK